jgi:hypothetical protein
MALQCLLVVLYVLGCGFAFVACGELRAYRKGDGECSQSHYGYSYRRSAALAYCGMLHLSRSYSLHNRALPYRGANNMP